MLLHGARKYVCVRMYIWKYGTHHSPVLAYLTPLISPHLTPPPPSLHQNLSWLWCRYFINHHASLLNMTYASELYWGEVALHICAVNGEASTLPMTRPSLPRLTTPPRPHPHPHSHPRPPPQPTSPPSAHFTLVLLTLTPRM